MSSSRYEKQVVEEEEGMYHRREYNRPESPVSVARSSASQRSSRQQQHKSKALQRRVSSRPSSRSSTSDNDNFEEWTTSKRKVNHKTRQVETRVSRQLLMEDGKVIADSGPQVTTRIKEDNKVDECVREKAPKHKGRFEALENASESAAGAGGRVLGEKKEIQKVSREVREENMQYHDERFKELTGADVHRRAIQTPNELITINDEKSDRHQQPRGKMVHYSNKGKKYQDTDEILEVAKLAIDGSITKERKHTRHHEEFSEDEKPDEKGEAEALRKKPIETRSSRKHFDYVNDFNDFRTPSGSEDEDERNHRLDQRTSAIKHHQQRNQHHSPGRQSTYSSTMSHHGNRHLDRDEVFPRYDRDPLLNSLHEDDFKPTIKSQPLARRYDDSSDTETLVSKRNNYGAHTPQPKSHVEIPEEYRVNGGGKNRVPRRPNSHLSSRSSTKQHRVSSPHSRHEDAGVQVHLTDEEDLERRSHNSHELAARQLEKQHSNRNSKRNYFYGGPDGASKTRATSTQTKPSRQRAASVTSSSSSSVTTNSKSTDKQRLDGVQSRDSGFKSPATNRQSPEDDHHMIYATSKKHHQDRERGVASPTPSAGQRSVKTTTTTFSAGLAERPPRRHENRAHSSSDSEDSLERDLRKNAPTTRSHNNKKEQYDNISVASLNPNATKIRVPYSNNSKQLEQTSNDQGSTTPKPTRAMHEGIKVLEGCERPAELARLHNLRNRLDSIQPAASHDVDHFDYRTIVANLTPIQNVANTNTTIINNNVHSISQHSPFMTNQLNSNNNDVTRLSVVASKQIVGGANNVVVVVASSSSGIGSEVERQSEAESSAASSGSDHKPYMLKQFMKQTTTMTTSSRDLDQANQVSCTELHNGFVVGGDDEDCRSISSESCSLKSCKTYNINRQPVNQTADTNVAVDDDDDDMQQCEQRIETLEACSRAPAWIFNPNDGSTMVLKPPARPQKPPTPETKTEHLAESRGGRSYYLELIEPATKQAPAHLPSPSKSALSPTKLINTNSINSRVPISNTNRSMESLYSRWSSMNTLSTSANEHHATKAASNNNKKRPQPTATKLPASNDEKTTTTSTKLSEQSKLAKSTPKLNNNQLKTTSNPIQRKPVTMKNSLSRSERQICPAKLLTDDHDGDEHDGRQEDDATMSKANCSGRPQVCIPFGLRSKSSSCLATNALRPSKYSIYGGLRTKDPKAVPRLSYSRAIGPRLQRPNGLQQVKTLPSRYLKMK